MQNFRIADFVGSNHSYRSLSVYIIGLIFVWAVFREVNHSAIYRIWISLAGKENVGSYSVRFFPTDFWSLSAKLKTFAEKTLIAKSSEYFHSCIVWVAFIARKISYLEFISSKAKSFSHFQLPLLEVPSVRCAYMCAAGHLNRRLDSSVLILNKCTMHYLQYVMILINAKMMGDDQFVIRTQMSQTSTNGSSWSGCQEGISLPVNYICATFSAGNIFRSVRNDTLLWRVRIMGHSCHGFYRSVVFPLGCFILWCLMRRQGGPVI